MSSISLSYFNKLSSQRLDGMEMEHYYSSPSSSGGSSLVNFEFVLEFHKWGLHDKNLKVVFLANEDSGHETMRK